MRGSASHDEEDEEKESQIKSFDGCQHNDLLPEHKDINQRCLQCCFPNEFILAAALPVHDCHTDGEVCQVDLADLREANVPHHITS